MSRIIYVKCDRCGKEFVPSETQRIGWIGLNWQNPDTDDLTEDKNPQTINYHLRKLLYGGDADDRNGESEA